MSKFPSVNPAQQATENKAGVVRFANSTEAANVNNDELAISPAQLQNAPAASTSRSGVVELATDAEAIAESASDKIIVASNLAALRAFDRITFASQPVATQTDGTTASGVDTEVNAMVCDGGLIFEYYNIGTQTILVPQIAASGLNIARDETDNEGTEITQGITAASRQAFTAQTDGPFYLRVTINAADVSGVDPLVVGFRKAGSYNSTYTSYSDFASIGIVGENDPAKLQIVTNLNGAGASTTDTTDTVADATNVTLEVIVDASGNVTYQIDYAAPSTTAAFQFDSGDVVVPFIHFTHATTSPDAVYLIDYECGLV